MTGWDDDVFAQASPYDLLDDPIGSTAKPEDPAYQWLVPVAFVSILCAAALRAPGEVWGWVLGYPLACLVPFTLIAFHRRQMVEKQLATGVAASSWNRHFTVAVIPLGLFFTVWNVWAIAAFYA